MHTLARLLLTFAMCVLIVTAAPAQKRSQSSSASKQDRAQTAAPTQSSATAAPKMNQVIFENMRWRLIGPFRGGRALAAESISDDPLTYHFGAVAGGGWKISDGDLTWTQMAEK